MLSARRVALDWSLSPRDAIELVCDRPRPFALIGEWAGVRAIIGSDPLRVADPGRDDPLALLDEDPAADGDALVGGGWFGFLGYDVARRCEPDAVCPQPPGAAGREPFALAWYDHVLVADGDGRWWLEWLDAPERATALQARLAVLHERVAVLAGNHRAATARVLGPWRASPSPAAHARAVETCRERILAGDLLQANVALRLSARVEGHPGRLFAAALAELAPERAAFVGTPAGGLVSLSPELFLERRGRAVRSAPIKGTRPDDDDGARDELLASAKDLAEHTMIVDLVRNDLGRVCAIGSVAVREHARAYHRAGVWHLVSDVCGTLRPDVGDGALLAATFPPASVTGAPKLAAMAAIAELESDAREAFTGAIGFRSPVAGLELSVAIRTLEVRGKRAWLSVGGGIVADSDGAQEARECLVKATPVARALGIALDLSPSDGASEGAPPPRLGPRPLRRPDPARGLLETVLVVDGEAVALDDHLDRLAASLLELYDAAVPVDLRGRAAAQAARHRRARLRMVVSGPPALAASVTCTPLGARPPVALRAVTVPGGIGAHKWADRRLLDALGDHCEPDQPLLCGLDGEVLEAARANVLALGADGVLRTPPLDGRLLGGVTRRHVLGLGIAVEERLDLPALRCAREVMVCGALGGVERVHALDGTSLPHEGMADALNMMLARARRGAAPSRR